MKSKRTRAIARILLIVVGVILATNGAYLFANMAKVFSLISTIGSDVAEIALGTFAIMLVIVLVGGGVHFAICGIGRKTIARAIRMFME